jgi:two-component system, LytTR family, response regulator LytT
MSERNISNLTRLRALIIDDEWPARDYLAELLQGSGLAEVVGAAANLDAAREVLERPPDFAELDVVFVDVRLVGERVENAGLEIIREFAGRPNTPQFVIASAFKRHTLEAFELGVVDYLVKPFSDERVEQCLRRVLARRPVRGRPATAGMPTRIVARRKRSLVFLALDEVWAIEAADRLTFVHTPLGRFELDLSLNSIEATSSISLTRVHRNWLVNLTHVREMERSDGATILYVGSGVGGSGQGIRAPVARERAQQIRDSLLAAATGIRRSPPGRGPL